MTRVGDRPRVTEVVAVEDGNGKKLINGVTYAAGQTIPTARGPIMS